MRSKVGFTFIETLIVVSILGILAGMAIPYLQDYIENNRLRAVSDHFYSQVKSAYSEAIKDQSNVYISFQAGSNWCYGLSDSGSCDCSTANDCQLNGVESVTDASQFLEITLSLSGYGVDSGISYLTINGDRGVVDLTGSTTFTSNGKSISVAINKLGTAAVCSSDVSGFESC